jgi:dTDP-glucose 4,6-dehydratase
LEAPAELVNGEVFNVGAAEERSILQNAELILYQLGKSHDLISFVPDRLGHVRRHAVDSAKLTRTLDWQAQIPFQDGITSTIDWYRTHTSWLEQVLARQDTFLSRALALAEISAER